MAEPLEELEALGENVARFEHRSVPELALQAQSLGGYRGRIRTARNQIFFPFKRGVACLERPRLRRLSLHGAAIAPHRGTLVAQLSGSLGILSLRRVESNLLTGWDLDTLGSSGLSLAIDRRGIVDLRASGLSQTVNDVLKDLGSQLRALGWS